MTFVSKGKNTPFGGWKCKGWPVATIVERKTCMGKRKCTSNETTINSRRWNDFYW